MSRKIIDRKFLCLLNVSDSRKAEKDAALAAKKAEAERLKAEAAAKVA